MKKPLSAPVPASAKHAQMLMRTFQQAQKMETVGVLAGGLAHDFNNILAGARAMLELLRQDWAEYPALARELALVEGTIGRAADLAKRLLHFSRPAQGVPQPTDLNDQVRLLASMLQRILPASIKLDLRLCRLPLRAAVDPIQFDQAVLNLALNARDAMPRGGRLQIVSRAYTPARQKHAAAQAPRHYAEIAVRDNGKGIPKQHLPLIFKPYQTGRSAAGGTGLGLTVVESIMHQHHGYVTAANRKRGGAVFKLFFPLLPAAERVKSRPPR